MGLTMAFTPSAWNIHGLMPGEMMSECWPYHIFNVYLRGKSGTGMLSVPRNVTGTGFLFRN